MVKPTRTRDLVMHLLYQSIIDYWKQIKFPDNKTRESTIDWNYFSNNLIKLKFTPLILFHKNRQNNSIFFDFYCKFFLHFFTQ